MPSLVLVLYRVDIINQNLDIKIKSLGYYKDAENMLYALKQILGATKFNKIDNQDIASCQIYPTVSSAMQYGAIITRFVCVNIVPKISQIKKNENKFENRLDLLKATSYF